MGKLSDYLSSLYQIGGDIGVVDSAGNPVDCDQAISQAIELMRSVRDASRKIMFIGNGGSAAIASHMAIDYSKNGRLPAIAFNDGPALTCLGNDLGYENVFSEQIKLHGKIGDLLVAISSSGASPNILKAVAEAHICGCHVITMSGFSSDNPLRKEGSLNWYVASKQYGFVELLHLTLCHAILDIEMGWSDEVN